MSKYNEEKTVWGNPDAEKGKGRSSSKKAQGGKLVQSISSKSKRVVQESSEEEDDDMSSESDVSEYSSEEEEEEEIEVVVPVKKPRRSQRAEPSRQSELVVGKPRKVPELPARTRKEGLLQPGYLPLKRVFFDPDETIDVRFNVKGFVDPRESKESKFRPIVLEISAKQLVRHFERRKTELNHDSRATAHFMKSAANFRIDRINIMRMSGNIPRDSNLVFVCTTQPFLNSHALASDRTTSKDEIEMAAAVACIADRQVSIDLHHSNNVNERALNLIGYIEDEETLKRREIRDVVPESTHMESEETVKIVGLSSTGIYAACLPHVMTPKDYEQLQAQEVHIGEGYVAVPRELSDKTVEYLRRWVIPAAPFQNLNSGIIFHVYPPQCMRGCLTEFKHNWACENCHSGMYVQVSGNKLVFQCVLDVHLVVAQTGGQTDIDYLDF